MSEVANVVPEAEEVDMRLRFLQLPESLAPLVAKHGAPTAEVSTEQSVFIWAVTAAPDEVVAVKDGSEDGLILARVRDESELSKGVDDVEDLMRALLETGRRPDSIIVSCDARDGRFGHADLQWAWDIARGRRLSWVAVCGFDVTSEDFDAVAGVFDWEPGEIPPLQDGAEQVLILREGRMVASNAQEMREGEAPDWRHA